MKKKYTEEEVQAIVDSALQSQSEKIERENRLVAIEQSIKELKEDIEKILENSRTIGFGNK